MKHSTGVASLRSLSSMGLSGELFIPALLEALHEIIPSSRNLFDWTDAQGRLIRYYFEGPIDHEVAAHYFSEFHNKRESEVMPAFQQAVSGHSRIRSAEELDNPAFFSSALYNEIWRPQGLHTRLAAVVKGARGQPLGSLVLYRAKGERRFTKDDEQLLAQVADYVARGLEAPAAHLLAADFVARRDRRAMLSLGNGGELQHVSPDALKLLLLSHGGITPENVSRTPRREDFPTLTMLWQHHRQARGPSHENVTLTVENAWGRFVYESAPLAPLNGGAAPMIHVNIEHHEPEGVALHRVLQALPLSSAQREVCALLHRGHSQAEIARALSIAPSTVADHVRRIYDKLDVHSVHELGARIGARPASRLP